MSDFSFDHLTDVQFEEFCYDLLTRMGATEVSWRIGTGFESSTPDQGRDIECYFIRKDPDGAHRKERWFVDCKHYKEGVPPAKVQGALAWAAAERPDVLLLIASNAFSNSCKSNIQQYRHTNRPHFEIKLWERKTLESLTISKPDLLCKYGMTDSFPFLKLLHPAHVLFLRRPPQNTLKFFFSVLEKAGPHRFREALSMVYMFVIKPKVLLPTDPNQTLRDLIQEPLGYVSFRQKCYELARSVEQPFLVRAIVNEALSWAFAAGDKTDVSRLVSNNKGLIESLEKERSENPKQADKFSKWIDEIKQRMDEIPQRVERSYVLYASFCEEVVGLLFEEEVMVSDEMKAIMEKLVSEDSERPKGQES